MCVRACAPATPAHVTQQLMRGFVRAKDVEWGSYSGDCRGNLQSLRSVFMCFSGRTELCFVVPAQRSIEAGFNKGCWVAVTIKPLNGDGGTHLSPVPLNPFAALFHQMCKTLSRKMINLQNRMFPPKTQPCSANHHRPALCLPQWLHPDSVPGAAQPGRANMANENALYPSLTCAGAAPCPATGWCWGLLPIARY